MNRGGRPRNICWEDKLFFDLRIISQLNFKKGGYIHYIICSSESVLAIITWWR